MSGNKDYHNGGGDGIVEGDADANRIDLDYTGDPENDRIDHSDAILPGEAPQDDIVDAGAGDDTILAGEGDDDVFAGSGNDEVAGEAGDDLIFGDLNLPCGKHDGSGGSSRESFEWDLAPNNTGFVQNTGSVDVTFRIVQEQDGSIIESGVSTDSQNISGIIGDGNPIDPNSSFGSDLNGQGNEGDYNLEFSSPVENVSFRVNDVDGDGIVRIKAFDENGQQIEVNLSVGSNLTLLDTDGVPGGDQADSNGGRDDDTSDNYSVLVDIPGPVARLTVQHDQDGAEDSNINITDVYFDAPGGGDDGEPGDDTLSGGDGDDTIFGEGGNDQLEGGRGADLIVGGDDRDTILGGTDGDLVDGSTTGDDYDTLDLSDSGPLRVVNETTDADGDSTSGTIEFLNGDGEVTGSMEFREIENLILPEDRVGPVDGEETGEEMGPGYDDANAPTDGGGDQIDGTDGNDDTIFGNGGDDTIDSGLGDDTVDGGAGDDVFDINDEGNGIDNDVIIGGETDETDGDTIDTTDIGDDLNVVLSAPETGTIDDGTDTTTFEEIENISLGGGDDTVEGSDGDDNVTTDGGGDSVDGNDGDDFIDTSGGGAIPLPDRGFAGYGPVPAIPADADPLDDLDTVNGGAGNDTIFTGDDDDVVRGGDGNDVIDAGLDDDTVRGNAGDDSIIGGEGSDVLSGQDGDDTIYGGLGPSFPDGANIPDDGTGPFGPDPDPTNGMDTIDGGQGNDLIFGEDDDDVLVGGEGNDTIDGGIDDDSIRGQDGDDSLFGGQGNDTVQGGAGNDTIFGGEGDDDLQGRADRDLFTDATAGDTVDGGTGGDDFDTLDLRGSGPLRVVNETTDADGDSTSGTVEYLNADGDVTGSMDFFEIENVIPCFTPGTVIATPRGERRVEDLQVGDRIITRDNGLQEIRWVGHRQLSGQELLQAPHLKPVLIRAGSLGHGLPERDMMVSPQHRILINNERSALYFDEHEVLAAAKHLTAMDGVDSVETSGTTYIHFMFDQHEVVLSNGAWTESFQPGESVLDGMGQAQRDEIYDLFPELRETEGLEAYQAARRSLRKHEARLLVK